MENFMETCNTGLEYKIRKAIRLLQSVKCDCFELSYSGGKDSDVILELCKMAGVNFRIIHKCTTIDPPYTLSHCKNVGAEVLRPKESMFEIIRKHGFPTRRSRHCCKTLKEYKVLPIAIQGIRRAESGKRKARYKEPIICRIYGSKKNKAQIVLPVLDWSDADIKQFIIENQIKVHPLYYEKGVFDVRERLGCIGCPLAADNGLSDFKRFPKMAKAWIKAGKIWWDTHPNAKSRKKFQNVYELFVHNIFFNKYEDFYDAVNSKITGKIDCKEFLENYFNIKL